MLRSRRSTRIAAVQIAALALLSALLTGVLYLATEHRTAPAEVKGVAVPTGSPTGNWSQEGPVGPTTQHADSSPEPGAAISPAPEAPVLEGKEVVAPALKPDGPNAAEQPDGGEPEHTGATPSGRLPSDPTPASALAAPDEDHELTPPLRGLKSPAGRTGDLLPPPRPAPHGSTAGKPVSNAIASGAHARGKPVPDVAPPVASGPPSVEMKTCWTLWRSGCAAGGGCPIDPGYAPCGAN